MARSKAPQDIHNRRKKERPKRRDKNRGPLKTLFEIVGVVGAFASLLGILAFLPRMSIQTSESFAKSDPMASVFTLSNDSILPVNDVDVGCGVDDIETNK